MHARTIPLAARVLVVCGETAGLSVEAGMGPNPTLPPPRTSLILIVKVAPASSCSQHLDVPMQPQRPDLVARATLATSSGA